MATSTAAIRRQIYRLSRNGFMESELKWLICVIIIFSNLGGGRFLTRRIDLNNYGITQPLRILFFLFFVFFWGTIVFLVFYTHLPDS